MTDKERGPAYWQRLNDEFKQVDPTGEKAMEIAKKFMSDQEKDRLIAEALNLCWHVPGNPDKYNPDKDYQCAKCFNWFENCEHKSWNPDFSTWPGFGLIMEIGPTRDWWPLFLADIGAININGEWHFRAKHIHPPAMRDTLSLWLSEHEGEWREK